MGEVISIFRNQRTADVDCPYCKKRVIRTNWDPACSWSFWCKDGERHGPLWAPKVGTTNSLMDESNWIVEEAK